MQNNNNQTKKLQIAKLSKNCKDIKECLSIKFFFIFLKLFIPNWLAIIIIIYLQATSKLTKFENLLFKNTIGLYIIETLKLMPKAAIFIWL